MNALTVGRKIRASASLGDSRGDSLRLGLFHFRIALARAIGIPMPGPVVVRLAPDGHEMIISDDGELAVLHEVLLHQQYEVVADPAVIVDLGANVGFATLYFSRRYPEARIVAVEADPNTYSRLVQNVQRLPRVTTYNAAMSSRRGKVKFYCSSSSSIGSALSRQSELDREVDVDGMTLGDLLAVAEIARVDLLKIDIEGAEVELLENAPLDAVDEIVAELHFTHPDVDTATISTLLADFELEFSQNSDPDFGFVRACRPTLARPKHERRSVKDRRSGADRRSREELRWPVGDERRAGTGRRVGADRRRPLTGPTRT